MPLNRDEAIALAQGRYGSKATCRVARRDGTKAIFLDFPRNIVGWGKTWEEAFAMAIANKLLGVKRAGYK